MRALSWKWQGIGSGLAVQALKELRKKYDPIMVFLMETKNGKEVLEKEKRRQSMEIVSM